MSDSIEAIVARKREERQQREVDHVREQQAEAAMAAYKEAVQFACWFNFVEPGTPLHGTYEDWAERLQQVWHAAEAIGKQDDLLKQLDRQVQNASDAYLYAVELLRLARDPSMIKALAAKLELAEELHLMDNAISVRDMLELITVKRLFQPEPRQASEEQDTPEVEPTAQQPPVNNRSASGMIPQDWQAYVLSHVCSHHCYDGQLVDQRVAAIKQKDLMTELGIEANHKGRVSEAFKALFGGQNKYMQLCRHPEKLLRKLRQLSGEEPAATGKADRIDGIDGGDESLVDLMIGEGSS